MTNREVYLEAAQMIENRERDLSCIAVVSLDYDASQIYARTMAPKEHYEFLSVDDINDAAPSEDAARNFRVLLLLMMAACCDDMEDQGVRE